MKTLEQYKWICPEPFTNIQASTSGFYKPCCVMTETQDMAKYVSKRYSVEQYSIMEHYNSDYMQRLRNAMRNENDDEYVNTMCKNCKVKEDNGVRSHREWYLDRFTSRSEFKHKKEELEDIIANNKQPTFFHSMELDALGGNYCNLSCNMCSGYSSSKYLAEEIQLKETYRDKALILPKVNEKIWEELPTILENLCELKLVGGEPLISKNTYRLMEMVPHPENTILRIITNGTHNPDKFINLAKKFKQVIINLSIEGVGEVNNYIRYPSKWNDILNNRIKLTRVGKVILVSTINALNINKLYQIPKMGFEYTMSSLVTNNFYSLKSIPNDIKDKYLNELYQHKMVDLIKLLESSTFDENDMWNMLRHIKRRDGLRKTNLLNIWPEWKEYYENCRS